MLEKLLKDEEGDIFRVVWPGEDTFDVPSSIVRVTPEGDVPLDGKFWARVLMFGFSEN